MNKQHQLTAKQKVLARALQIRMFLITCLSIFSVIGFSNSLHAMSESDNLAAVEGTPFEVFEVANNIGFSASKKVYVESVNASYSRSWMREFRSQTSRGERNDTLQNYAESLRSNILKKLKRSGWNVLEQPEDGAIIIHAKLENVYIEGPDLLIRAHPMVLNIGSAELELELYDANSNLALHIHDHRLAGSPSDSFIETNRAMNYMRFNKLFYGWANDFDVFLNVLADLSAAS